MGFCCTHRHGSNLESQIREPPTGFHRVKPIPFWWNNIESNGFHFQGDFCCFIFGGGGVMKIVNLTDTFRWWRFWYLKLYFSIFFALHWGDDCPNWLTRIFSKRVCSTTNYYWGISTGFTLFEGQGLKAQLGPLVLWQIHADSKTFGALTRTFQQVPISTRKDVYLTPVVTELVSKMKCPGEYTKIWVVTFFV